MRTHALEVSMGMFDEVRCNHELFGVHKGETYETKDIHCLGGLFEQYEITPSGHLELLEYTVENRSNPTLKGLERLRATTTMVFTGGRRDLNYHGWLELSGFGRAKFTDGALVAFEPEPNQAGEREECDEVRNAAQGGEGSDVPEGDSVSESTMEMNRRSELAAIAGTFRGAVLPGWDELDAFVNLISPALRAKLAWRLNKSLGINANAIRQLLEDRSIEDAVAEEWLRFEEESD